MPQNARILPILSILALSACAWIPVPRKPGLSASPFGAVMKLKGRARMESSSVAGPVVNPFVDVSRSLNLGDRDTGVGANLAWSDGFSGAEVSFFRWKENELETTGILDADFGNLRRDEEVRSEVLYQQLRVNWISKIWEDKKLTPATLRAGSGIGIHHNEFKLESHEVNNPTRIQNLKFRDDFGVPMLLGRLEAEYRPFKARIDLGWFRGDIDGFNGTFLDLGLSLHYQVQKGVSVFGGWWRYDLPGEDVREDLGFEFDMKLTGLFAGITFEF